MGEQYTNPESEAIRQRLVQWRAFYRRAGKIVMWILGIIFVLLTISNATFVIVTRSPFVAFLLTEVYLLAGCGCMFYLMGFSEWQRGRPPVTDQEIELHRQHERAELFRQSLGHLPVIYRPWWIILESLLGVCSLGGGIALLLYPLTIGPAPSGIVIGVAMVIFGPFMFWLGMMGWRDAKYVPTLSVRTLRGRMIMGEATEGPEDGEAASE